MGSAPKYSLDLDSVVPVGTRKKQSSADSTDVKPLKEHDAALLT